MMSLFDVNRWRRMGWPRIIIYIVCFLLTIHLLHTFLIDTTKSSSDSSNKTRNVAANSIQSHSDFPWYTSLHPSLTHLQNTKDHTTLHLSTQERDELQERMVAKAASVAHAAFPQINGILGSQFENKPEAADKFRRQVDCWTSGQWVATNQPSFVMPHFQDPLYGSCDRQYKKHGGQGLRDAVRYVWQPSCKMDSTMDPGNWCQIMRGRHMLIVGDLVQYQLHEVFLDTLRDGPAICFGELNCKDHTMCTEPYENVHMRYLRNDVLSTRRKMNPNHGHPKADVIEWPFISAALMRRYPILLLNRAPVLESDDQFINSLVETMRTIRKGTGANSLIIYRSTGIGHPFCNEAQGPLTEPLTDTQLKQLPFGWGELKRRNAIARTIVEAAGGVFVDLGALTDLRPDGHIGGQDCLRYCIPGPLDSWAQILYQVFMGLEK